MPVEPAPPLPSPRIQIHRSDARRPVVSLVLTRWRARAAIAALALLGVPALAAVTLGPYLLWSRLSHREYRVQLARRTQQGDRLQAFVRELGELSARSRELERQLEKIRRIYGLEPPAEPARPAPGAQRRALESIYSVTVARADQLSAELEGREGHLDTLLDFVEASERARPGEIARTPAASPLRGVESVLVAGFGARRNPYTQEIDPHFGIDLAAPMGTPVRAAAAGVVSFTGMVSRREGPWWRLGQLVAVRHGERFITLYGHLGGIAVRPGQRLEPGEVLGTVGDSGWSTTVHLHYEIRRRSLSGSWVPVDPRLFILDSAWEDEERVLAQSERPLADVEPLPGVLTR